MALTGERSRPPCGPSCQGEAGASGESAPAPVAAPMEDPAAAAAAFLEQMGAGGAGEDSKKDKKKKKNKKKVRDPRRLRSRRHIALGTIGG